MIFERLINDDDGEKDKIKLKFRKLNKIEHCKWS
jgi:hypothetical protein